MTTAEERCSLRADVIARTTGGGYVRIPSQQCVAETDHADDHEFIAGGEHIFGVSFNRKLRVYEARR